MFLSDTPSFKKVSLLTIGIFAPTFALAAGGNGRFEGYYGGVMGGVLETNANISASALSQYLYSGGSGLIAIDQDHVKTYRYKGIAEIYLGYGDFYYDTDYYWAIEIFARTGTSKNTLNDFANDGQVASISPTTELSTSTTMRLKNFEYGADFLPGYQFDTNSLIYGRIGIAFNQLTLENSTNFGYQFVGDTINTLTLINGSQSRESAFLRLGVGLEHKISSNMSLTADYIYTHYGKLSTSSSGSTVTGEDTDDETFTNPNGLSGSASGRFSTNAFMVGIRYFFFH